MVLLVGFAGFLGTFVVLAGAVVVGLLGVVGFFAAVPTGLFVGAVMAFGFAAIGAGVEVGPASLGGEPLSVEASSKVSDAAASSAASAAAFSSVGSVTLLGLAGVGSGVTALTSALFSADSSGEPAPLLSANTAPAPISRESPPAIQSPALPGRR